MANAPRRPMLEPRPCASCGAPFSPCKPKKGQPVGVVCGRLLCWARTYWTDEEWAGRKRMAEAHLAVLQQAEPGHYYQPPDAPARWMLPGWTELDQEAMARG